MKVKAFILLSLLSLFLLGASNFETFNNCIQKGDYKCAKTIIDKWGPNKTNDPQYYICVFNYHMNKSRTTGLGIQKNPPKGDTVQITDPLTGEAKGYFASIAHYDEKEAQKGIESLKVGIKKFPDHYEMRFGLIWMYKELYQLDNYLLELESALYYLTSTKPSKIFWNNNESITAPNDFVLDTVQGNFSDIWKDEPSIFDNTNFMHKYCDLLMKYFPSHKYGYSDKAWIYYSAKDLQKAISYHLKAFSLDNQDELIAVNIAFTYRQMGDRENAIKYFNKVLEIGKDPGRLEYAKQQLEELRKK
jgi:tetratricopeptide (TPR) repeat protein